MESLFSKLAAGTLLNDPFVIKLFLVIILFLGLSQGFKIIWSYINWLKGNKQKEVINGEKGKWKKAIEELTKSVDDLAVLVKNHDERAARVHGQINWLYNAHQEMRLDIREIKEKVNQNRK